MLDNIKNKFIRRKINLVHCSNNRCCAACNLNNANSLAIIYNATNATDVELVKSLTHSLHQKNINIYTLGFVKSKTLNETQLSTANNNFFSLKDLNWYGLPNDLCINEFCNLNADILLNFDLDELPQLTYILAKSNAKFKVGRYSQQNETFYDLMINLPAENANLDELIKQIFNYLQNINYAK